MCNSCNSCNCCGCSALARALNNLFSVANSCGCNCGCNSCNSCNSWNSFGNGSSRSGSGFGSCNSQNFCCSDAYYARQYALWNVNGSGCNFCCCRCCNSCCNS